MNTNPQPPRATRPDAATRHGRLKRHSAVPLYLQIHDDITARIESGELAPGSRLPSEPEMTREYGVGRPTVRQAIDRLRRAGIVATVRGSGTFVANDPSQISLLGFDGLTRSLRARGVESVDEIIGADDGPPPLEVLTPPPSTAGWWTVQRLRSLPSADGEHTFCVETDSFNLDHCPEAAALFDETRSASAVLDEGYGFAIARCDVATRALTADQLGLAGLLATADTFPLLVMERLNWSASNEAIHAVRFVVRTDRVPIVERIVNPTIGG